MANRQWESGYKRDQRIGYRQPESVDRIPTTAGGPLIIAKR